MAGRAFRAGIIGWPVGHSLSPVINAWWRKRLDVPGSYEHLPCEGDSTDFDAMIAQAMAEGFDGLNVTIPHKANAAERADEISPVARQLGVANTLSLTENRVYADNTDMAGFLAAVDSVIDETTPRGHALVLGAGGAAPAVCLALHRAGYSAITVSNRTRARAEALAQRFAFVTDVCDWEDFRGRIGQSDIVVNTTSLGMHGSEPMLVDFATAPDHQIVADIIYTPLETPLLASARERGLKTFNGLLMLAHQAVPGFEAWSGVRPTVTPDLIAHLEDRLAGRLEPATIALTGSIGMGKTTVAAMFARLGAAIWNADDAVHRLYAEGGLAVEPVGKRFAGVLDGQAVSREKLSAHLLSNPDDFAALEAIVHPLVARDRQAFVDRARANGALACVMDIPLLFENGGEGAFDCVVTVRANEDVRRARVLDRPGMTLAKYEAITARQMPDADKIARSDHVIRTDVALNDTFTAVRATYREILEKYVY